jgi:hypothetical protein
LKDGSAMAFYGGSKWRIFLLSTMVCRLQSKHFD